MATPKQSLKSLTFAALPKREANPVQERRTKTIARLEEHSFSTIRTTLEPFERQ